MTSTDSAETPAHSETHFTFRQRLTPFLVLFAATAAYLAAHLTFFDGYSLAWVILAYLAYAIIRTRATAYEVTPTHFIRRRPWRTLDVPWSDVRHVERRHNLLGEGVAIVRGVGFFGVIQVTFIENPDTVIPRVLEAAGNASSA
jgi:hypothetical protein